MSPEEIAGHVVGVVALITLLSAVLGAIVTRVRQPTVVGQILTGLLLCPTILGSLPFDLSGHLFPPEILPFLKVLADVAIVIFMFTVGYELDLRALRGWSGGTVLALVGACLLVPMTLGTIAVLTLPGAFEAVGEPDVTGRPFVMFVAVSVSVTALPVLAAIVRERNIAATLAGRLALAVAGVADLLVWLVLAAAVAGATHRSGMPVWQTALLAAGLILVLFLVVRPALRRWAERPGARFYDQLPLAVVLMMGCAWATNSLGLHAVFGGFLAGLVMPRPDGAPDADLLRSTEGASRVLLPLFFVVTGLSLHIGGLDRDGLTLLALVLAIAVTGKLLPVYAVARATRLSRHDSATIAALLNTRGLTELIALNVGLSSGLIHRDLFAVLVMMALITTAMTGPLLTLIDRRRPSAPGHEAGAAARSRPGTAR